MENLLEPGHQQPIVQEKRDLTEAEFPTSATDVDRSTEVLFGNLFKMSVMQKRLSKIEIPFYYFYSIEDYLQKDELFIWGCKSTVEWDGVSEGKVSFQECNVWQKIKETNSNRLIVHTVDGEILSVPTSTLFPEILDHELITSLAILTHFPPTIEFFCKKKTADSEEHLGPTVVCHHNIIHSSTHFNYGAFVEKKLYDLEPNEIADIVDLYLEEIFWYKENIEVIQNIEAPDKFRLQVYEYHVAEYFNGNLTVSQQKSYNGYLL